MFKNKFSTVKALLFSRTFILVTEKESYVYASTEGITASMQLSALKTLAENIGATAVELEEKLKEYNGRK